MARPAFLQDPTFPFWPWLTNGRLFLAAAWLACLSIAVGRHVRSATEYDSDQRPPPRLLGNPFRVAPTYSPEVLAEKRRELDLYSTSMQDAEGAEEKRAAAANLTLPGNFPESGNFGHMEVDFGAQWLLGRMVVRGYGQELYNRTRLRQVARESFLIENEPLDHQMYHFPAERRPKEWIGKDLRYDPVMLVAWTVGGDNDSPRWPELGMNVAAAFGGTHPFGVAVAEVLATDAALANLAEDLSKPSVGGPLYPPVHAILYAPLGMIADPRVAYYLFQLLSTFSLFVAAFAVSVMTGGRVRTPVAATVLLLYPGFQPGLTLAQNHVVSLAVVMVGWALLCRNRPLAGGLVWGLLAFKPVWAVAFGLVPLLMWRPRFLAGMAATGLALVVATLPVVGVHGWQNWLTNGGEATQVYNRCMNWINLSRDLSGIVRRPLLDFTVEELDPKRNPKDYALFGDAKKHSAADLAAWASLGMAFAATVVVYRGWGRPRVPLGLSAGFLFLGAYLCCFRFMYYDALLSAIGVVALFAWPWWFARRTSWDSSGANSRRRARWAAAPWLLFATGLTLLTLCVRSRVSVLLSWAPTTEPFHWKVVKILGYDLQTYGWLLVATLATLVWHFARQSRSGAVDPNARRWHATVNSLPLTLLLLLLLLQTYFLTIDLRFGLRWPKVDSVREFTTFLNYDFATDTFVLMGLWVWAGWRMIRGGHRPELEDTWSRV